MRIYLGRRELFLARQAAVRGWTTSHISSRENLLEAARQLAGSMAGVSTWLAVAKRAQWGSLEDLRKTFGSADGVPVANKVYTVFNIAGNRFRLIVKIEYEYKKIFIKHLLTHADYTKGEWK
jgi:mRNA interferase HigB